MRRMLIGLCGMFCGLAEAQSLGVVGEVFPVAEVSFLVWIESRLQDADVASKVKRFEARASQTVTRYVTNPPSLNLPPALKHQTHRYVPAITLKDDIRDAKGHILIPRGTTVNALAKFPSYQPYWLFFDSNSLSQCRWAQKELEKYTNPKIILTGGSIQDMTSLLKQEVFFDQGGRISHQLGIAHVPAKVTRKGNALMVQEVAIREDGDAR